MTLKAFSLVECAVPTYARASYHGINPVRARLVARAQDWRWSRTRAYLTGKDDGLTARRPIRDRFPRFADLFATEPDGEDSEAFACLRAAESIGRPLGDDRFLARIERVTKRILKPQRRGPKPRTGLAPPLPAIVNVALDTILLPLISVFEPPPSSSAPPRLVLQPRHDRLLQVRVYSNLEHFPFALLRLHICLHSELQRRERLRLRLKEINILV